MKKLPVVLSVTMLISGLGMVGMPVVMAEENNNTYSLIENAVNPMLRFSLIDTESGEIGIIFNEVDDNNLVVRRVRLANYNYDKYTQAMVEAKIELLMGYGEVEWAMVMTDYDDFDGQGGKVEKKIPLTNREDFFRHNPGVVYYMVEYRRSDTGEVLQEYGKLNYRDCVQYGEANYRSLVSCNLNSVGGRWEYERVNIGVEDKIKPWKEELADYLENRFRNLDMEPDFFGYMTDAEVVARKSELYEMIGWLREVIVDADEARRFEIYDHSQRTYELIFGEEDPTGNPYRNSEDNDGGEGGDSGDSGDGGTSGDEKGTGENEGDEGSESPDSGSESDTSEGDELKNDGGYDGGLSSDDGTDVGMSGNGGLAIGGLGGAGDDTSGVKWPVILQPMAEQAVSNDRVVSGAVSVVDAGGAAMVDGDTVDERLGNISTVGVGNSDENVRDIANFGVPTLNEVEEKGKTWWIWSIIWIVLGLLAGIIWWVKRAFSRNSR